VQIGGGQFRYNIAMQNHPHLAAETARLMKLGNKFEYWTMVWNLLGLAVLSWALSLQMSVALMGVALVSLMHVFASIVVLAQLTGLDRNREHLALKVIALGYGALTLYMLGRSIIGLLAGKHYADTYVGILWLGLTYFAMWAFSSNKRRVGLALHNQVLVHVAQMNRVDAYIALAVMSGLLLNAFCDFYWADPVAGLIIVGYSCESAIDAWKASVEHARLAMMEASSSTAHSADEES
jgi:Co/Zn/Cd efflux system component